MPVKVGEIGKRIFVSNGGSFDMSGFTDLVINLTSPSTAKSSVSSPRVVLGVVDQSTPLGDFLANTYVYFDTEEPDFNIHGDWTGCLNYQDASRDYDFDDFVLPIGKAC